MIRTDDKFPHIKEELKNLTFLFSSRLSSFRVVAITRKKKHFSSVYTDSTESTSARLYDIFISNESITVGTVKILYKKKNHVCMHTINFIICTDVCI